MIKLSPYGRLGGIPLPLNLFISLAEIQNMNDTVTDKEFIELSNSTIVSENNPEHILNEMGKSFEQQAAQVKIQNEQAIQQVSQQINNDVNNSILPMFYSLSGFFVVLILVAVFVKVFSSDENKK